VYIFFIDVLAIDAYTLIHCNQLVFMF
jgi:hypothetical protein